MGLNTAMDIGRNALMIFQTANEVTSQNIANVNTPGYSRQKVVLESGPTSTAVKGYPLESGVRIANVERVYDGLLQQQMVSSGSTQSYDTTKSQVLQQIEPSFNETNTDGLGAAVSKFFASWQDLTTNPAGYFERQAVISRAQGLADNFHSVSQTLTNTISAQDAALAPLTNSININLQGIARLNAEIKNTDMLNGNDNGSRDQRDQLIRDLSQQMGVKFTDNRDGTTDVYVYDSVSNTNIYLVQGTVSGSLTTGGTPPASTVTINDPAGTVLLSVDPKATTPLYSAPDGGQLWGTLQLRDKIIPGYLTQIDTLAESISTSVNALHSAGFSPTGATGQDFFATWAGTGAAANFKLDLGLTSSTIAASSSDQLPGDNSNALKIAKLANGQTTPAATPTATFSSFYSSFVSSFGMDVQSSKAIVAQDDAYMKQLTALRDSNSGVSLDEELTNLLKYQRSYQASAKVITTVSDMLDITLAMIR
ncbi:MAG TPA: flagellar hook-associated protein FlgK [Desulfuromonadales bacterium]|nr:flagellar hook-associated protein FlgK [Desulfuromonadales bacterium]